MSGSQEKQSEDASLQPQSGRLERIERDEIGRLVAYLTGCREPLRDVRVARCFPWSLPSEYVSIRNSEGQEVALLKSLEELDSASREIAEAELRDKVFNPQIRRVVEYSHEFGVTSITAETDRGQVTFQIRSRDDVRVLSPTHTLFRDADGNTYELSDFTALDAASQAYLRDYF